MTTVSLMYLMMRTLWSLMTQLKLKIKQIIRKKSKQNTPSKQIKISSFPYIPSKGSSLYLGPL